MSCALILLCNSVHVSHLFNKLPTVKKCVVWHGYLGHTSPQVLLTATPESTVGVVFSEMRALLAASPHAGIIHKELALLILMHGASPLVVQ